METNTDFVVFSEPFGLDIDKIFDGNPTSRGAAKNFCGKIYSASSRGLPYCWSAARRLTSAAKAGPVPCGSRQTLLAGTAP
jgi:hypothetical protein